MAAVGPARNQPVASDQHRVDDQHQPAVQREAHEVAAPLDAFQRAPHQHRRERLADHDAQDGRIAGARRGDALAHDGGAQAGFDMDEIGELGHRSIAYSVARLCRAELIAGGGGEGAPTLSLPSWKSGIRAARKFKLGACRSR